MSSLFEKDYQDLEQWRELGVAFQSALDALPPHVIEPELPKPDPEGMDDDDFREDLYQALLAGFLQHAESTVRATSYLVQNQRWPQIEPDHAFYLRQMLTGCLDFLKQIAVGDHGRHVTIFPFPNMPVPKVFLWMMVEWWLDPGLKAHIAREASTEKIFFRQYDR